VSISVQYLYDPLFGRWVLSDDLLRMRTASVMRNE
jgi:hypothetical protein